MGDAVGPVGKLLVGSAAAISDQRNVVAKAFPNHAVGQLNPDIQPVGIVEPGQVQVRPGLQGWQPVARETVGMAGGTKHVVYSRSLPTLSLRAARECCACQSGMIAVASISTLARSSIRAITCTTAIAG